MMRTFAISQDFVVPVGSSMSPRGNHQHPACPGRLTLLSLALAASFTTLTAQADCLAGGRFSSSTTGTENWSAGDCSIDSGVSISSGSPALLVTGGATVGTLTNNGTIRGGETGLGNNSGNTIGSIVNNGLISSFSTNGIRNDGTIGTLTNAGSISAGGYYAIYNDGLITTLSNTAAGSIRSVRAGIYNSNGTISTLNNDGTITGSIGINNVSSSSISTLNNNGTITGSIGINNISSSISTLTNDGVITGSIIGIYNGSLSTISSLINSGTISGSTYGIQSDNNSSITSLTNTSSGAILGKAGILVGQLSPSGTINVGTLINDGSISGSTNVGVGTSANGTIGSLTNNGIITAAAGAIGNAGSIGSLNNSGTISSNGYAIYNASTGTLGPITNSGLIAGNIMNLSSTGLTINGGSGSISGVLTGANGSIDSASMGTISHAADNLSFNSGNLILNDHVNVGTHSLINTGATLQVNNHVNITGNYDQGAASTLLIGVGNSAVSNGVLADTGYGRLVVSGAANIASGSSVSLKALNSYGFAVGQRYVVVQAATNGTNYNASDLIYSATGYNGNIVGSTLIDGNTSNLLLTLGSGGSTAPSLPATTPNAVSAISGLFKYNGTDARLLNVFNASAALDSSAEANRVGAQLNPSWSAMAASQASAAPTKMVLNVASARLDGLRSAQGSGVATGEGASDTALWGQVFGGKATQNERDNISGYSANFNGLLFGSDYVLNDSWRVGGLFSYANTSVDGNDDNTGSSVNLKSYGLIPYAGYTAEDWYLDMSGGVVQHKYNTRRLINFTGVNGVADGDYDGLQTVLSTQAGYPIRLDAQTVLTPIAGLNYSRLKQDGYTESGGAGAALSVSSSKSSSLTSDLGAKLERSFDSSYGRLEPSAQLTWRHEYKDTRLRSFANFAIDTSGSTSFTAFGPTPISDTGIMALGATLTRKENLSLAARYTVEAASGYVAQTVDLRLRYEF